MAAILFGLTANAAEPEPTPESRARFEAGVAALRAERWNEAYREFKVAYEMTPKWTALGNLGIAADHLERDGEAIDALEDFLKRGGAEIKARERARVRRRLDRLQGGLATVTLEASGTSWVVVDTRLAPEGPVVNQYGPFERRAELRVRAGKHEFQLEGNSRSASAPAWAVTVLPGDTATHRFALVPENELVTEFDPTPLPVSPEVDVVETHDRSHTASYVLWGTGAAAALGATLFLVESSRLQNEADDDFERRCPAGATGMGGCDSSTEGDRKAAGWRTLALVTGIGALGTLATGTVLYFLDEPPRSTSAQASVLPWVSPRAMGLMGEF